MVRKIKRVIGNYAFEILISIGFVLLVLVCWGYSTIGINDTQAFWASVYPSAFVDIISVVVSTILITYLVNRKKVHDTKKDLYTIIRFAHNNLFTELYGTYLLVISVRDGETYGKTYDKDELRDHRKIGEYLEKHLNRYYNHEKIIINKNVKEKFQGGVVDKIVTETVARSYLFEQYVETVRDEIDKFLKEYHYLLSAEYMSILVEIKEELRHNPFLIFKFDKDDEYGIPAFIIDFDKYISNNKKYIEKVYKLHEYFLEVK